MSHPPQVAVSRISHLQLARAFTRWVEAAQELKALRAKAQQVLRNTLRRRMRTALASWQAYVEHCGAKRARLALAERHWRQLYRRRGLAAWSAFVKVTVLGVGSVGSCFAMCLVLVLSTVLA